jgi:hypothetical protein
VSTTFEYEQAFPADIATVTTMISDPAYVQEKGQRTGSHDVSVEVVASDDGGFVITSTRSMPAKVPSFAAPFVGDTITVTEVQTWGPPADDGSASASVTVAFNSPIAYEGTIELTADGAATRAMNAGEFKAGIPFLSGKVERVAADQTERYLAKEVVVAEEWLAR